MSNGKTLVWFRQDLRLADNPALHAAAQRGAVIPVYIWAPAEEGAWRPGGATKWWLHHSLESLDTELEKLDSHLVVRTLPAPSKERTSDLLATLVRETGADAVYFNRRYEESARKQEEEVVAALEKLGTTVRSFNGSLIHEPYEILNNSGEPYKVYTAYARACLRIAGKQKIVPTVRKLDTPPKMPKSDLLNALHLLPSINWDEGISAAWTPGEVAASKRARKFIANLVSAYTTTRNQPAVDGVSRMSPHLHFGEMSPRVLFHLVESARDDLDKDGRESVDKFLGEILWREFAYYTLYHQPHTAESCLRQEFNQLDWRNDKKALESWQRGQTGVPIVDAGMRELWTTGWMHNRVRMIAASFLVKDLLISWQKGAAWFWDTLVDADLANNTMGWQWVAGCGVDAAPYFRIMNPTLQGKKFDPDGAYVRRWVPELREVPSRFIHEPWLTPPLVQQQAGVEIGTDYPTPIIDHSAARQRVLTLYKGLRAAN